MFIFNYKKKKNQCSMENGDDWLVVDKVYHILFCFSLTLLFSTLANRTRYRFLRRYSLWVASISSLAAGAAKEVADEIGFFKYAGCDAPTRHRVSSEGSYIYIFFKKLITFTLAYSNNVKHLTCIILCSSGLQNINTSSRNGSV